MPDGGRITTDVPKPPYPPASPSGVSCPTVCVTCGCRSACSCVGDPLCTSCRVSRCIVCAATQHTSGAHVRRLPYDEAKAVLLNGTPCAAHFACIGKITCQKPGADRD